MPRILAAMVISTLIALAGPARSQTPGVPGGSDPLRYSIHLPLIDLDDILNNPGAASSLVRIDLEGIIDIPHDALGTPLSDGRRQVEDFDRLLYELLINATIQEPGGTSADVSFTFTPGNSALVAPFGSLYVNGDGLEVDGEGLSLGTPLLDLTADRAAVPVGFPDGLRFGDDPTDLLIVQLFSGSVNLGFGAVTDPGGFFSVAAGAQLTPDDVLTIARLEPVTAVPLPAGGLLLASALGLTCLGRCRRVRLQRGSV